jgi:hypothetical protein
MSSDSARPWRCDDRSCREKIPARPLEQPFFWFSKAGALEEAINKLGPTQFFRLSVFTKVLISSSNFHFPVSAPHSSNPRLFNALPFDSNDTYIILDK